ncbi:PspC domain-containing protein [Terrimesophilobacter mesophilus]|uniref:PspC domain-containing protein n=2 Tax=Terrimesophilobacter mesophilus TaxID=433647 RepID=A0A4R8VDC5_9MICO|nr:PspC domain-containing protein [Terrimesophilobacter mesophilus]
MAASAPVRDDEVMPTKTKTAPPPPPAPTASSRFFDWMRGLGVTREPGWIGGVCAGVAARLGIDPIIVRGIAVVVAVLGGPALLLYAAAWLLLPDADNRIHLERVFRGEFYGAVAGIGVVVLLALLPISQGFWFSGPWFWDGPYWGASVLRVLWTLAIVGGAIWLVIWLAMRANQRPGARPMGAASATASPAPASADATDASETDAGATAAAAATTDATAIPEPIAPPAPPSDPDGLAAWKEQQAAWRREHAAWRAQQSEASRAAWLEQRRIRNHDHAERRAEWERKHIRTRSNPLFTAVAIGVALVAGAATALAVGAGEWTPVATITGLAVTLGVLGLAIVFNGFSGRTSGGSSGVAVLVVFALIFTSFFGWVGGPVLVDRDTAWSPSYSDGDSQHRTVISGDAELDLRDYFAGASSASEDDDGLISLTVIAGNADVIVPADASTDVRGHAVAGSVTFDTDPQRSRDGAVVRLNQSFEPLDGTDPDLEITVEIWVISGDLSVRQATR